MDRKGRTTILHAVDSHNEDALCLLLRNGADPNPRVGEGLFRSSPLTAATFGGLVEMIKLLLCSGAKVDEQNPEGRTALQVAASLQNVECAEILLKYGANLNHISKNGHSPFTTAIACSNHTVLNLFVDRGYSSRPDWNLLLRFVAQSADAETISILGSSDLLLQQTLLDKDVVAVGRETLWSRLDYTEKLGDAFEELLTKFGSSGNASIPK